MAAVLPAAPGRRGVRAASAARTAVALVVAMLAGAATAAPAPGRYEATLCVRLGDAAANCGAADLDVRAGGDVQVQVSDIVYRLLSMRDGQAVVVVTQGTVQIDEFDAAAEWSDTALRFVDAEKRLRYEVQVGVPRRVAR